MPRSTKLLLRAAPAGAFVDSSRAHHAVVASGDAAQVSLTKFGNGAMYFDGDGDYVTVADS